MPDTPTSEDELPLDDQPIKKGELSEDEKLDIALEGSMMTSEPPQISEPKRADTDD
jgi:hypothetical protein